MTAKEKSRRIADIFSRAYSIAATMTLQSGNLRLLQKYRKLSKAYRIKAVMKIMVVSADFN